MSSVQQRKEILQCIQQEWHLMWFNTLGLRQRGIHFADILKCIPCLEINSLYIQILLKFVTKGPVISKFVMV